MGEPKRPTEEELREALIVMIERCSTLPNISNVPEIYNAKAAAKHYGRTFFGFKYVTSDGIEES